MELTGVDQFRATKSRLENHYTTTAERFFSEESRAPFNRGFERTGNINYAMYSNVTVKPDPQLLKTGLHWGGAFHQDKAHFRKTKDNMAKWTDVNFRI